MATAIGLIGAPTDIGAGMRGASMGPEALRVAGIQTMLESQGLVVSDQGNLGGPGNPWLPSRDGYRHLPEVVAWNQLVHAAVLGELQAARLPILLGGDHSLAIGSISAVARHCRERKRKLRILWLDAHADFNTPETSPSGNVHGMPVAMLCREPGLESVMGNIERVSVKPQNVHLFGIRSVDRGERALLAARGIHVADMRLIDEFGVVSSLKSILDEVQGRNGLLHVSLDVDFLDPSIAPGVGTPVPGGATYREAHLIMEMLHDSGLVVSLDIVELNPFLDDRGRSAKILVDLAASLFGRSIVDRPQQA